MNEISLHILDIVQNSIAAGASHITVEVVEDEAGDRLTITVADDGKGMDTETAERVLSPFATSRTTRRVGLGIPLFREGCLACDGDFSIESVPGRGTTVRACYRMSHIDRPPLGNLSETVFLLIASNPELDFTFRHGEGDRSYELSTEELRQTLGEVPITEPGVLQWIREYLDESELNLHGGANPYEDDTGA